MKLARTTPITPALYDSNIRGTHGARACISLWTDLELSDKTRSKYIINLLYDLEGASGHVFACTLYDSFLHAILVIPHNKMWRKTRESWIFPLSSLEQEEGGYIQKSFSFHGKWTLGNWMANSAGWEPFASPFQITFIAWKIGEKFGNRLFE